MLITQSEWKVTVCCIFFLRWSARFFFVCFYWEPDLLIAFTFWEIFPQLKWNRLCKLHLISDTSFSVCLPAVAAAAAASVAIDGAEEQRSINKRLQCSAASKQCGKLLQQSDRIVHLQVIAGADMNQWTSGGDWQREIIVAQISEVCVCARL